MKDKLELKHLAPYLPYGVMFRDKNAEKYPNYGYKLRPMIGVSKRIRFGDYWVHGEQDGEEAGMSIGACEIALRPLSDLNNYENNDGDKVINLLTNRSRGDFYYDGKPRLQLWAYQDIEILHEHHFDTKKLIDKNLAIDINTLNNK